MLTDIKEQALLTMNYSIDKIVFINSCNHAYSELDLSKNLALFGRNNKGKTSSLVATKLLLYPEINFNDCNSKFKFYSVANNSYYGKEKSYDFYFPYADSYIIMEINNPLGTFCTVLFRANNYEYHRLLIQKDYLSIRHLFWNDAEKKFPEKNDLEIGNIIKQITDMGLKYRVVSKKDELIKLFYANKGNADSVYSLVPLRDNKSSSVAAFTSIYDIAFGRKEEKVLAHALAAIVEMQRTREDDRVSSDFVSLKSDYLALAEEKHNLDIYEAKYDKYEEIHTTLKKLIADNLAFQQGYHEQYSNLRLAKAYYQSKSSSINPVKIELENKTRHLFRQLDNQKNINISLNSRKNQLTEEHKKYVDNKQKVEEILSNFLSENPSYYQANYQELSNIVVHKYQDKIKSLEDLLKAIASLQEMEAKLTKTTRTINELESDIKKLQSVKGNLNLLSLFQLNDDTANIIYSLMPFFDELNAPVTPEIKEAFDNFAQLFELHGDKILLNHQEISTIRYKKFDKQYQEANIESKINEKKQKLSDVKNDRESLLYVIREQKIGSQHSLGKNKIETDLNQLKNNVNLINAYNNIIANITEKEVQLNDVKLQIENNNASIQEYDKQYQAAMAEFNTIEKEYSEAHRHMKLINDTLLPTYENIKLLHTVDNLADIDTVILNTHISDISQLNIPSIESAKLLHQTARELNKAVNSLQVSIAGFMKDVPCEGVDPYKDYSTISEFTLIMDLYKNTFQTLDQKRHYLYENISQHKYFLEGMLQEIHHANHLIKDTVKLINETLINQPVSNFKAIQLIVKTDVRFNDILESYKKHDINDKSLLEVSFYDTLIKFTNDKTSKKNQRLSLVDIIENVTYKYLGYDGKEQDSSQSNGTTTTANCYIISCLLSRIFERHTAFKMPIVVDELSQIDSINLQTIAKQVNKLGFSLFGATPDESTPAQLIFGRWINMDAYSFGTESDPDNAKLHFTIDDVCVFESKLDDENSDIGGNPFIFDDEIDTNINPEQTAYIPWFLRPKGNESIDEKQHHVTDDSKDSFVFGEVNDKHEVIDEN